MARFNIKRLLPTRSGFLLLLTLALIIGGLHQWITWVLQTAPEGSQVVPPPAVESPR